MEELLPGLAVAPLHPMLVHFPVALWATAIPLWAYAVFRRHDDAWKAGRLLFELGTLGGLVAAGAGFLAADALGHDSAGHDVVHVHRNLMLATTGVALVLVAIGRWRGETRMARPVVAAGSLVVGCLLVVGADLGAYMVYGEGVGVSAPAQMEHPTDGDHGASAESHEH